MTTITSVDGNVQWLDGGSMFGNAPRVVWEKWVEVDPAHRVRLSTRSLLIEHEEEKILCEVGIGAFFDPKLAKRFGVEEPGHVLLENLKTLGISHEDITCVILSHLHFDHAGGLLPTFDDIQKGNDGILFPNATYVIGSDAFERCRNPHFRDRASYIPGLAEKLEASGRMKLIKGDKIPRYLEDRISFRYTEGHTPGQMHTVFKGDKRTVVFAGDLIPGATY